ncbi:MAG: hypothetical protein B7Z75_01700 [Acidocella sp. 20-57-95]|nr:MAG: hypothetical protein B7Z75_01700 [Acidocella sp. 20-57-95]HQT63713.1 hypothetical protein [Acidocella sp.]
MFLQPHTTPAESGWAGILPAGLAFTQAVHECRAPEHTAGHAAFAAVLLAKLGETTPVLWVSANPCLYPPGLAWLGLNPARCLFAHAKNDAESLGTLEVALRGGMAGVAECGELSRLAARRLALAARQGGSTGFLLRYAPATTSSDSTAFATRWMISPLQGRGEMRLQAELLYAKGGQPGVFVLDIHREAQNGAAPFSLTLVPPGPAEQQRRTG